MIKLFSKFKVILFLLFVVSVFGIFNFVEDDKIWRAENAKAATSCKGPADVILVIDRSADMANGSKFSVAKSASVNFIDKLFATEPDLSYGECAYHQIGLVAFNNNIDSESLHKIDSEEARNYVQGIITQSDGILGGSYPSDYRRTSIAIEIAKNKLDPDLSFVNSCATKTMIVLTDGAPYYDIALARAHADSAKNKGVRIVSVGLKLDEIVDSGKRTEAEDFIRYISSTPSDCYYISESGNTLDSCTSVSEIDLETALDGVYNNITAAVCDESPPSVEIYRTPQNTLYSVDNLVIKSVATDDIGFESHLLRWSDNWTNPDDIIEIACSDLSGTVIECSTEELGLFDVGEIINYRSIVTDANNNTANINDPDPRSVTVANVSLNIPILFRNINNGISVTISDSNGKADLDSFSITIDAPALAGIEIEKAAMACSGTGSSWVCTYNFNTANFGDGCLDWTNGITDGKANNINVNVYVYADSGDMEIRQIASVENQLLVSYFEGPSSSYPGTCSDGINNDCDYKDNDPLKPIIDLDLNGLDEMLCDVTGPSVGISRNPSGDVYDLESDGATPQLITLGSTAGDNNGIKQHTIFYRENGDVTWQTALGSGSDVCNDADADGLCDEDASQSVLSISATIGPFAAGTVIDYYSVATDYSGNDNTTSATAAIGSFIVRSRECFGVGDTNPPTACLVNTSGRCCGGVCNVAISNPNSYDTGYCVEEICSGVSWEWGAANDTVICSASGNATECHSFSALYGPPPGVPPYFFDGGCEERVYTCSSGYCNYSVVAGSRKEDYCIGGGSLILNDYECVGNSCVLDPSPAVDNEVCDLMLDDLSIDAYDNENNLIVTEVLDSKTEPVNKVSLTASVNDISGIEEYKIYWQEDGGIWHNTNCGPCDDGVVCNCTQEIGPYVHGTTVKYYAWARDGSVNQTESVTDTYSFTVRDHECYDIPGGNRLNLTLCDSGNGRCCGGSCDSSVSSTPYNEECRVDSCGGTNWVYAAGNENDPCGSTDSCFDYYSLNNSSYSGCITGGNKCSSGSCVISSSLTSTPICNGNLLTNYSCDPDNTTGTCQSKDSNIDCSITGNYDSDSVDCNCDCSGYDIEEKVYSSLSFDGMDDYVTIPDAPELSGGVGKSISISLWFYAREINQQTSLISKYYNSSYKDYGLTYNSDDSVFFYLENGGGNDFSLNTGTFANYQWHHICLTFNGSNRYAEIYLDNQLKDSGISNYDMPDTSTPLLIGKWGDYINQYFNGLIDDVRIYNRALYPEEVEDHYNGIFADNTGLIGHWDFDEGTGETVGDSSGNGNDGSLSNVDGVLGSGSYNPSWDTGVYGSGLDFDGDDYVALNNLGLSTSTDSKVSVEFWMNWNGGNSQMPFGWDSYDLWFYDGSFGFNTFAGDIWGISSSGLSNEWIHIIAVFNNGDAKLSELYLDGNKRSLSQRRGSTGNGTVSSSARISGYSSGSGFRFNGLIDDVRIYDRALSETEAEEHYKGIFVNNSDLVGYWNFNEDSGTTAYDSSENGPVWMKHYHDSSENNVPINWQVCTDSKDNNCDTFNDNYDSINGISNCDGEVDDVYVTARAKNSEGVENSNLFSSGLGITIYDVDIKRDSNDFTISSYGTNDEFLIQQTIIEWTTDNWANKDNKACSGGTCKTCVGSAYSETGVTESGGNKILVDDNKSWTADEWQNFAVKIISGTGAGQIRTIVSNTDVQLTVDIDWTTYPDATSEYQISRCENESTGTATELGGSATLTNNTKLWIDNEWTGGTIEIISGTGIGQIRNIISNIEDKITVDSNWETLPNTDSQYRISKKGDVISSSSLSAGNTFNFRVCAWDYSVNNNKKCTDYHGIIILSSNLVPEITSLLTHEPNFCSAGLNYTLDWIFIDPDDGQASYEIQVKEGDNDFESTAELVIDAEKNSSNSAYQILSADFVNDNEIEYGKTYYWRVKATDDRSGGYEQTTEWENGPSFTTPDYEYPQVDFSAIPDHSNECLYEIGYSGAEDRCDFGEDITFSDDSDFVECTSFDDRCLTASAAKCDTINNICVSCESNDECDKFNSLVSYSCNPGSGICEASGSCVTDDDCRAADAAKCDIDSGLCIFCDDDLQCTNDKFGTIGIDYFCDSSGKCEDKEHRKWYFYNDLNIDSNDSNPVNNYIESVVDSYVVILEIKDILGKSCYKKKNIFLGGKKYPKWNEMSPSSN